MRRLNTSARQPSGDPPRAVPVDLGPPQPLLGPQPESPPGGTESQRAPVLVGVDSVAPVRFRTITKGNKQTAVNRLAARPLHGRGVPRPGAPASERRPASGRAGCHSGSPPPPPTSSRTDASGTTAPPSPADVARNQALAAYRAMWSDMTVAARTADYRSPLLPHHAAGKALSILVRGLYTDKRMGIVVKGKPVTHARVVALSPPANPSKAQILDCFDGRHWLTYKVTGGLQNNVPGGFHRTTATVADVDGVWKVTQLRVERSGTCREPSSSS